MNVDLPAPGTPEMPMRKAPPAAGASSSISRAASSRWSAAGGLDEGDGAGERPPVAGAHRRRELAR